MQTISKPYPIRRPRTPIKQGMQASMGARGGFNQDAVEQYLSPSQARIVRGYIQRMSGKLERMQGSKSLGSVNTTDIPAFFFRFNDRFFIMGYGTVLSYFDTTNNTFTTIKGDFSTKLTDGLRYGAFVYTCNGSGEPIYVTTLTLNYKTQTSNFTVGDTITGAASGATALIRIDTDGGATGTLTLDQVSGVFLDGEIITDQGGGSATVNGSLSFATAALANSPYANRIFVFATRLLAGGIARGTYANPSTVIASDQDTTGTGIPFSTWTIDTQIDYASQTGNFTVGKVITGSTSGATGVITADNDLGTSGTLTLTSVSGTFVTGETITDPSGGSAKANSLQRSSLDADRGFKITDARKGDFVAFGSFDNLQATNRPEQCVLLYKNGYSSFHLDVTNISGIETKREIFDFQDRTQGALGRVESNRQGVFFANANGINLLERNGNAISLTRGYFGDDLIGKLDFSACDMKYLPKNMQLVVTCRNNSGVNNQIYILDTTTVGSKSGVAWFERRDWYISRIFVDGSTVYGTDSAMPKVYQLFVNWDNDGSPMDYEYEQMIVKGGIDSITDIVGLEIQGFLTPATPVTIEILGIDENGARVSTGIKYIWQTTGSASDSGGYDSKGYDQDAYDGIANPSGMVWTPVIGQLKAYGYRNLILRVSGSDNAPHVLAQAIMITHPGREIRSNRLTPTT